MKLAQLILAISLVIFSSCKKDAEIIASQVDGDSSGGGTGGSGPTATEPESPEEQTTYCFDAGIKQPVELSFKLDVTYSLVHAKFYGIPEEVRPTNIWDAKVIVCDGNDMLGIRYEDFTGDKIDSGKTDYFEIIDIDLNQKGASYVLFKLEIEEYQVVRYGLLTVDSKTLLLKGNLTLDYMLDTELIIWDFLGNNEVAPRSIRETKEISPKYIITHVVK